MPLNIKSGDHIFVHTAAAAPTFLLNLLCDEVKKNALINIHIYHLHLEGPAPHVSPEFKGIIFTHCFFVGDNCRSAIEQGQANYIPIFLSEIPLAIKQGLFKFDVALMHLSPFDQHGYASLGPSVDISLTAMLHSKRIIAQINQQMPRVLGEAIIHKSKIDQSYLIDTSLPEHISELSNEENIKFTEIGKHVASLIEDGATLQMGIGAIPDAVLQQLKNHKHLGIHSEMISDRVIDLVECGAIDNSCKKIMPGKIVSSFAMGSKRLYSFLNDNPLFHFMSSELVNNPNIIQKNPHVCAINSAIEVDLSGQVCADSIGHKIYSGVGGQVDFLRGAALSPNGKAIIAMTSTTRKGKSKIVCQLAPGSGVVSTRAHVHYVVTEFGVASLHGKDIQQRAEALINIAHPDHRKSLRQECLLPLT